MNRTAAKGDGRKEDWRYYFKAYPAHGIQMLERLNEQRTSGTLCDITVHVEDDHFRAHRCMLVASCETFKELIDKDSRNDLNMSSDIKSKAFIVILDYIYTGSVTLEEDCVQNVMYAAKYFNLPDVEKSCRKFLNQLYQYRKRNKTLNQCEALESELSYSLITVPTNNTEFKSIKTLRNSPTASISNGKLSTLDFSCGKNKANAVAVNKVQVIIEPKIEIEEETEMILHPELADACAYVSASKSYDDCFDAHEISAISVQTLNENTSDDQLLESVLVQVNLNHDSFMTNILNESDRSNICIKRETNSASLENIQQTIQTSMKKYSVQQRDDRVRKRIKTSSSEGGEERIQKRTKVSSAVKREKKRVRKRIKSPVLFLDNDRDTVVFNTDFENVFDKLGIVVPLNGLTSIEQPMRNSSDGGSNTCDNHLVDSLEADKCVLKGHRRRYKDSKRTKRNKYAQNDSISLTQDVSSLLICTICNRRFVRACDFTRHRHLHNLDTFKCQLCDEEFKNVVKFKQHSIGVHAIHKCFVCPQKGCNYKSHAMWDLKQHVNIHSDVKHFQCVHCGKSFAQENGLRIHRQSCLQEKSYLCDFCGMKFNLKQELVTHLRVHTGERPYQCDKCSAQFTDNPNYKRHRRIHENAFPYSCHLCEKKFRHSNSLKAHMVNH